MSETESLVVTRYGGPEVFQLKKESLREPAAGEVVVRVKAAGLNFADIFAREGLYGPGPKAPFVPGFEDAGEVEASESAKFPVGAKVIAVTRFGGYTRRVVAASARVFPVPDGWTFEEAAGFPAVYLTAWHGIANVARMRPGERLLVHSAAGGVGIAAGQIARALGLEAIGTVPGRSRRRRKPATRTSSTTRRATSRRACASSRRARASTSSSTRSAGASSRRAIACSATTVACSATGSRA
jgi:alcohol dehydrogenase